MSPGVITFQYAHDLAQSPGVIAFQNLTWLRLCRLSPGVITFHYVTLIAPGAFVVTVDVVVVVDVVCGSGRKTQISRVVAPQKYNQQKYNQLNWLSSR
jgi:hypothetical protein